MNSQFMQIHINSTRVIYETVDDETLIIDSETGVYYVLRGSGTEIWQIISQGVDLPSLINQVAQQHTAPVAEIQPALQSFISELQKAGLVTLSAGPSRVVASMTEVALRSEGRPGATFVPPELHTFNDMHDLLLIDPIHEVAETGWPFTPTKQR